jgi:hypothetical protein
MEIPPPHDFVMKIYASACPKAVPRQQHPETIELRWCPDQNTTASLYD